MVEEPIEGSLEFAKDPVLRLFVAVPLWGEFQQRNQSNTKSLRSLPIDLKWVRPDNWHVTLKFLGSVPASAVPQLANSLTSSLEGWKPFSFELGGLGGFPRLSKCRILWVGATEGRRELIDLANRVGLACAGAGFRGDRKNFQAHLTLGRSRGESLKICVPKDLFEASWGEEKVESVSLVKSDPGYGGAKYEVLETITF